MPATLLAAKPAFATLSQSLTIHSQRLNGGAFITLRPQRPIGRFKFNPLLVRQMLSSVNISAGIMDHFQITPVDLAVVSASIAAPAESKPKQTEKER
jgi:hypothetical protein